jgi:hypothetical protein
MVFSALEVGGQGTGLFQNHGRAYLSSLGEAGLLQALERPQLAWLRSQYKAIRNFDTST